MNKFLLELKEALTFVIGIMSMLFLIFVVVLGMAAVGTLLESWFR